MFMGPLEASLPWVSKNVDGAKKFLDRVWRLVNDEEYSSKLTNTNDCSLDETYNKMVKKVTEDFENLKV